MKVHAEYQFGSFTCCAFPTPILLCSNPWMSVTEPQYLHRAQTGPHWIPSHDLHSLASGASMRGQRTCMTCLASRSRGWTHGRCISRQSAPLGVQSGCSGTRSSAAGPTPCGSAHGGLPEASCASPSPAIASVADFTPSLGASW